MVQNGLVSLSSIKISILVNVVTDYEGRRPNVFSSEIGNYVVEISKEPTSVSMDNLWKEMFSVI